MLEGKIFLMYEKIWIINFKGVFLFYYVIFINKNEKRLKVSKKFLIGLSGYKLSYS